MMSVTDLMRPVAVISRPGRRRRIAGLIIVFVTVLLCLFLAWLHGRQYIWGAIVVLFVSLAGFSLLAGLTFDSVRLWRAVDYLWICITFGAAAVALVNLNLALLDQRVIETRLSCRIGVIYFINTSKKFLNTECRVTTLSDIQRQVCERLPEAIERLEFDVEMLSLPGFSIFDRFRLWPSRLIPEAHNNFAQILGDGAWRLYSEELSYFRNLQCLPFEEARQTRKEVDSYGRTSVIASQQLKYWYLLIAFFTGLRLSRTTAELLQTRAR
jgi:hypothetical protein